MVFHPSLEQESPDGFYALVEGLLDEIFHFASLVPRIAKHNELPDYQADVEEVRLYSLVRQQLKYHLIYLRLIPVCSLADLSGVARYVPNLAVNHIKKLHPPGPGERGTRTVCHGVCSPIQSTYTIHNVETFCNCACVLMKTNSCICLYCG